MEYDGDFMGKNVDLTRNNHGIAMGLQRMCVCTEYIQQKKIWELRKGRPFNKAHDFIMIDHTCALFSGRKFSWYPPFSDVFLRLTSQGDRKLKTDRS